MLKQNTCSNIIAVYEHLYEHFPVKGIIVKKVAVSCRSLGIKT